MKTKTHRKESRSAGPNILFCACLSAAFLLGPLAGAALAEAGFEYNAKTKLQSDQGKPSLELTATGPIKSGTVTFKRADGKTQKQSLGGMRTGEKKKLSIEQPAGTFSWDVSVEAVGADGEEIADTFEMTTTLAEPLSLSVDPEKAHIGDGKVMVGVNRPLERIEVEVYDEKGKKLHENTLAMGGKYGDLEVSWPVDADVAGVRMTAHDVDGFWQSVLLEPFWVEIPHKEIIFDFGKATWAQEEVPKLEETLQSIREAMEKYRDKGLQMQLYVAGYTDTVGSAADNLRLSAARARAIGQWFRKKGLKIPIFYQGFGESVLAVQTPDDTKEEKNRRAIYVLGNARPPVSEQLPKANWKPVR